MGASLTAAFGYYQLTKRQQLGQADAQVSYPYFHCAAKNSPKFKWRYKGGEDAYLISDNKRFIGVADGVGGWNSYEVCSGKLSKFLCKRLAELYGADTSRDLKSIFYEGVHDAIKVTEGGSTTMVLAKLEPEI